MDTTAPHLPSATRGQGMVYLISFVALDLSLLKFSFIYLILFIFFFFLIIFSLCIFNFLLRKWEVIISFILTLCAHEYMQALKKDNGI